MSFGENFLVDNFFIIDSKNLNQVTTSFYGYSIDSQGNVFTEYDEDIELTSDGAYVLVDVYEDKIVINQDFMGSYGLYLYQNDDYFAISNSFIKLVDYIKLTQKISLNQDYANDLLFTNLCSRAYKETLVNEIECLSRNCIVTIDKSDKTVEFDYIDYGENTIPIDSKNALDILDDWFYKWVNIIRLLKSKTNNLAFHLSGGFDSRIIAVLWLSANINLNDIKIVSINDHLHTHEEDFEIASEIADKFNFKLNEGKINEKIIGFEDIQMPMMNSFYTKQGFHKEMYFKTFRYEHPVYTFTGSGGGVIRELNNEVPSEFIEDIKKRNHNVDYSLTKSSINLFENARIRLNERFAVDMDSKEIVDIYHREVRNRIHFGKSAVETFFANDISLTPLLDSNLIKIKLTTEECKDNNLLMALIFSRFYPQLLEFKIEGNRGFRQETIDYANKINEQYPFELKDFTRIPDMESDEKSENIILNDEYISRRDIDNYLEEIFNSRTFEKEFEKYFSFESYSYIHKITKNTQYYPLKAVYAAIAVLKIIKDVEFSNRGIDYSEMDWLDGFFDDKNLDRLIKLEDKKDLIKFATARLDIKNNGENNSIEVIKNSDEYSRQQFPRWFEDSKGKGLVIESYRGELDLQLQCVNKGNLEIKLKGVDIRDESGNKLPIYINYTSFMINGEKHIENVLTKNDEPFVYKKEVEDQEIVEMHVEWHPLNSKSVYQNKLKIKNDNLQNENWELLRKLDDIKSKCNQLEIENKNLKEKNDSKSSKFKSFLRK